MLTQWENELSFWRRASWYHVPCWDHIVHGWGFNINYHECCWYYNDRRKLLSAAILLLSQTFTQFIHFGRQHTVPFLWKLIRAGGWCRQGWRQKLILRMKSLMGREEYDMDWIPPHSACACIKAMSWSSTAVQSCIWPSLLISVLQLIKGKSQPYSLVQSSD